MAKFWSVMGGVFGLSAALVFGTLASAPGSQASAQAGEQCTRHIERDCWPWPFDFICSERCEQICCHFSGDQQLCGIGPCTNPPAPSPPSSGCPAGRECCEFNADDSCAICVPSGASCP